MTWTKENYEEDGRKAALYGWGLGPCPDQDGWRKTAWLRGYDAKIAEDASKNPALLTARQEHIRLLTKDINSSKIMSANRLLRIAHKIAVLQGRENQCAST